MKTENEKNKYSRRSEIAHQLMEILEKETDGNDHEMVAIVFGLTKLILPAATVTLPPF